MLSWLKKRNEVKRSAASLYEAIVAQSRLPHFYIAGGVPDTVEGRFEVVVLHMFLVFDRLKEDAAESEPLIYQLGDTFMDELDGAMREMGVGDMSIPKKMRLAASGFLGRLEAYHKALHLEGEALAASLARNVYGDEDLSSAKARDLARYVAQSAAALRRQPFAELKQGRVAFLTPSEIPHGQE